MTNVRLALIATLMAVGFLGQPAKNAKAEIIDIDVSAVAEEFVPAFRRAEAFWDARILGYSNTLPREVQAQLNGRMLIFASTADLGGNVIGAAGPTTIRNVIRGGRFRGRTVAVATVATMAFDNAFLATATEDELTELIIHEMAHALGFGSLWEANGLLRPIGASQTIQYVGINARRAFAREAGIETRLGATGFVPIEQQGGPGTQFGHWEDDSSFFNTLLVNNRIEIMTGTMIDNAEGFLSQTTLASMVDLHYVVAGFNENELIRFPQAVSNGTGFPKQGVPIGVPPLVIPGTEDNDGGGAGPVDPAGPGAPGGPAGPAGPGGPEGMMNQFNRGYSVPNYRGIGNRFGR